MGSELMPIRGQGWAGIRRAGLASDAAFQTTCSAYRPPSAATPSRVVSQRDRLMAVERPRFPEHGTPSYRGMLELSARAVDPRRPA